MKNLRLFQRWLSIIFGRKSRRFDEKSSYGPPFFQLKWKNRLSRSGGQIGRICRGVSGIRLKGGWTLELARVKIARILIAIARSFIAKHGVLLVLKDCEGFGLGLCGMWMRYSLMTRSEQTLVTPHTQV